MCKNLHIPQYFPKLISIPTTHTEKNYTVIFTNQLLIVQDVLEVSNERISTW